MGVPGVEVRWAPVNSERWISGYEVRRDDRLIGRAYRGTFLFDHSAGADTAAVYSVCSVSAEPRRSRPACSVPASATRSVVVDNTEMELTGPWSLDTAAPLAHEGTVSVADKPAEARFTIEGRSLTLHSRLGITGGLARIVIDGVEAGTANCYAADEIPAWPIFEKQWSRPGRHEVRIQALGSHDPRSKGATVWLDAATVQG